MPDWLTAGCRNFTDVEARPGICCVCGNDPAKCPYETDKFTEAGYVIVRRVVLEHLVVAEERLSAATGCCYLAEAREVLGR